MGPETRKCSCIVSREAAEGEAGDRHGDRRQKPEKHREAKEECVKAPIGLPEPYYSWRLAYNNVCLVNVLLASSEASMELHSYCRVNLKLKPLPQHLDSSTNCTDGAEVTAGPPRCPPVNLRLWDTISGASEHRLVHG